MRIDEWVSFAKRSSVDEFTTRWPAPFLMSEIVGATAHDVQYGHMTIDTHAPPVQVLPNTLPEMIQAAPLRVEPIIKSARNPFNDRIFVGRAKNTDLVLENESVSKVHAYFEPCFGRRLAHPRLRLAQWHTPRHTTSRAPRTREAGLLGGTAVRTVSSFLRSTDGAAHLVAAAHRG